MRRLTRRLAVCKYKSKNVDKDLEQTLDHMTFRGRLKDDQKSKISCVGLSTYINHAQIQRGEAGGPDYLWKIKEIIWFHSNSIQDPL